MLTSVETSLSRIEEVGRLNKEDIISAVRGIEFPAQEAPIVHVSVPDIKVPTPQVHVKVPEIKVPESRFQLPEVLKTVLDGYDNKNPVPVMLFDQKGKPFQFTMSEGGGGRGDFFTIIDIKGSSASLIDQVEGALKVTGNFSITSSGATTVSLINSDGTYYNSDNPLPVIATIPATLRVDQLSGANFSVFITGASGTNAAALVDSTGAQFSGSNPLPITIVSSSAASTSSYLADRAGSSYDGTNPLPITVITSSVATTVSVGDVASDGADTGSAPLKTGGIARSTQPSSVSDGDRISSSYDLKGRQVMRTHQVRDLLATAYTTLSTGTEATLATAAAAGYLDLMQIVAANDSSAAVLVDVRAVTAGNKVLTLEVPANGTAGIVLATPWPQDATGNSWTVDMPDITGTNVYISALFSKES